MLAGSLEPVHSLEAPPTVHEPFWLHRRGRGHKLGNQHDVVPCVSSSPLSSRMLCPCNMDK